MTPDDLEAMLSRRALLKAGGAAGLALTASGLLVACGDGSDDTSTDAAGTPAKPGKGGRLAIGTIGIGTSESYDPGLAYAPTNILMVATVFDPLVRQAPDHRTEPGLALEMNPNADATVWEIKLRPDVVWHDGKPFTADDVIYTMRSMAKPGHVSNPAVASVRINDLRRRGDLIVEVPLERPYALFPALYTGSPFVMIQDGTKDFSKPVGTGPFKLQSFTPGKRSALVANEDYWDDPRPYLDELEIISISDESARVNALESGQIDIASPVPFAQARANQDAPTGSWTTVVGAPGVPQMFAMRVDQAPFDDVRVRQAMKLIADRPALIESALNGYGTVGNDIVGQGLRYYDDSLPQREQDIEQAKSLLKAAGQSDLRVTLQTSDIGVGVIEAATVLAQQATEAGVAIKVQREPASAYFNASLLYLKMTFSQSFWTGINSLPQFYDYSLVSDGVSNETHWSVPSFDALVDKASGTLDEGEAERLWSQAQEIQYEQGGYIVWGLQQLTSGIGPRVAGYGGPGAGWTGYPDDNRVYNWGVAS